MRMAVIVHFKTACFSVQFYGSTIVRWFEISAICLFALLAFLPFFIKESGWFSIAYFIVSIIVLGIYTIWFCWKLYALEKLTREHPLTMASDGNPKIQVASPISTVVVKNLEIPDISECARILADAYRDVYDEPWTHDTAAARLKELYQLAPDYCFVLKFMEEIAGFACARTFAWHDGTHIWIEEVVVDKPHRGMGWSKLLMQTLAEKCRIDGIVGVSLISRRDSLAFGIYTKMGLSPSDWVHMEANMETLP